MAIVRLSIEVLQGRRDSDDEESHAAAVAALADLQKMVCDSGAIHVYTTEQAQAPWGVPRRPDTFNLDFDTDEVDEIEGSIVALGLVVQWLVPGVRDLGLPVDAGARDAETFIGQHVPDVQDS